MSSELGLNSANGIASMVKKIGKKSNSSKIETAADIVEGKLLIGQMDEEFHENLVIVLFAVSEVLDTFIGKKILPSSLKTIDVWITESNINELPIYIDS